MSKLRPSDKCKKNSQVQKTVSAKDQTIIITNWISTNPDVLKANGTHSMENALLNNQILYLINATKEK